MQPLSGLSFRATGCYSDRMEDEAFGPRVRRMRVEKKMGQRKLAGMIGRSKTWLVHLETEQRWAGELPPGNDIQRLAQALDTSVFALTGGALDGEIGQEEPVPVPNAEGDYDYREVRRFVESNPDPNFRARLARQEARRTPESYQRLIFRIFKAWLSNADLGLGEAEEEDDLRPGTDR